MNLAIFEYIKLNPENTVGTGIFNHPSVCFNPNKSVGLCLYLICPMLSGK